jgi:transposase
MRFAEIRSPALLDLQALHRIRDRIVANRTQLICQIRAFCLEYGVTMRQGAGAFKMEIASIIGDETNDLIPMIERY